MAEKSYSSVLVYSSCWPVNEAIAGLCQPEKRGKPGQIMQVFSLNDLLRELMTYQPDILVLDISPHQHGGLLNTVRVLFPALPVMIVQSRFLFSDRVVAEYFGHVWLKEYDALLAAWPSLLLQEHLTDQQFSGTQSSGYFHSRSRSAGKMPPAELREQFGTLVRKRLYDLTNSPRLCEVVMDWLIQGESVAETGRYLSRSHKVIYHYRCRVMKLLNIRNASKDFVSSLTVRVSCDEKESDVHQNHAGVGSAGHAGAGKENECVYPAIP